MLICDICDTVMTSEDACECPVCGNIVCAWCYDGEMCDRCRDAFYNGHTVFGN